MANVTHITQTALALSATSCFLSILGGLLIIATFLAIPEIRNFTRKLMVCLTIADLLTATGYSVSIVRNFGEHFTANNGNGTHGNIPYGNDTLCTIQGTLTTFSSLASFFLTSITAIYIFDTVIHRQDRVGMNAWLLVINMLSWGLPGKKWSLTLPKFAEKLIKVHRNRSCICLIHVFDISRNIHGHFLIVISVMSFFSL